MSRAQVVHNLGPPSAMVWQEWAVPDPGPGEVRLRHTAIGVNFADTYHRGGVSHPWPVPPCPVVVGFEGVGIVEGVGEGVTDFNPGDRVAYGIPPLGSYAGGPQLPRREAPAPPGRSRRPAGRSAPDEGNDRALPAPPDLRGPAGRHHPGARGRGRHGPDSSASGRRRWGRRWSAP